jgi:hypothetical protein
MNPKHKETYFLLVFLIILLLGFFLGRYFTFVEYYDQQTFNAEELEECHEERSTYQALCGYIEELEDDIELQECINSCYD